MLTVNSEFIPQTKSCEAEQVKMLLKRHLDRERGVLMRPYLSVHISYDNLVVKTRWYKKSLSILIKVDLQERWVSRKAITFNFLVGAHPDPSNVCSRNKLKENL